MSQGDHLSPEEEVVRAFFIPHWDEQNKRATPSAFIDKSGVSVSRLAILSHEEIIGIYKHNFDGQQVGNATRYLRQTGRLAVSRIYELTDQRIDGKPAQDPPLVKALVVADPVEEDPPKLSNPAHALIEGWDRATGSTRKEFSRTVAKRLLDECIKHDVAQGAT